MMTSCIYFPSATLHHGVVFRPAGWLTRNASQAVGTNLPGLNLDFVQYTEHAPYR